MIEFEKTCPVCQKAYKTFIANQKYCSLKCREQAYGLTPTLSETRKCKVCGKDFEWSRKVRNKIYCSKECGIVAQQQKNGKYDSKTNGLTRRTEQRICVECGKPFLWSTSKPNQVYCSSECRISAAKKGSSVEIRREERSCEWCGKKYLWFSNKWGQKYCSEACRAQAQKEKNKVKERRKKENNNRIIEEHVRSIVTDLLFRAQKAAEISKGISHIDYWSLGDVDEDVREMVLERDQYQCQICGSGTDLRVHPIVNCRNGGTHSPENLITLCNSCHRHIDTGDLEHAISKCTKNAYRCRHMDMDYAFEDKKELLENAIYILQNLFSEFCTYYPAENEYLTRLDTVIETLEKIKWYLLL